MFDHLLHALKTLTRIPTGSPHPEIVVSEAKAATWFPAVGAIIGLMLIAVMRLGAHIDVWFAALGGLILWMIITGARHLVGLIEIAELWAERGETIHDQRTEVPVAAIWVTVTLMSKLVLLMLLSLRDSWWLLPMVLAWSHFAPLMWANALPTTSETGDDPLKIWRADTPVAARWAVALVVATLITLNLALFIAPLVIVLWRLVLKRLKPHNQSPGVHAGIELVEISTLAAAVGHALLTG